MEKFGLLENIKYNSDTMLEKAKHSFDTMMKCMRKYKTYKQKNLPHFSLF